MELSFTVTCTHSWPRAHTHTHIHKHTMADMWMKLRDIHTEGAINVDRGGRAGWEVRRVCLWGSSCVCVCVRGSVSLEPPHFPSTRLPLCECVGVCVQACLCVCLNGGFVPQSVPLYFARFLMIFQWWFSLVCVCVCVCVCAHEHVCVCLWVCVQGFTRPLSLSLSLSLSFAFRSPPSFSS